MTQAAQELCRVCKSNFLPYAMGEKNGYTLVACKTCGAVMTQPFVKQTDLDQFYGDVQPEATHMQNHEVVINGFQKILQKLAPPGSAPKRFLDAYSRQGYAVKAAQKLGMQAVGVDAREFFFSFAQAKYPQNKFEHKSVQDYAAEGHQADIIFSIEALSEQPDPDSYIAALSKVLAPGGVIYFTDADGNHFNTPSRFANWGFVEPPINFLYVSKDGLEKILARHGLKVQKYFWSWAPFIRALIVKK